MKKTKIAIAGTGYVGLALGTMLATRDEVVALDIIKEKVDMINNRISPIKDEYIEKLMSKPGGPTAAEFKKIQKLHAEALRRFVTRNPNMRNAAAEQYLNNGIPVLQWDTNKLSSLSPYDQQVGKMLFGDFYKRGNRYLNAGGRAHGTSIKGKNANAVIELGYDTPVNFDTLFTLDHESRHILDKRAQPGMYNLSKYAGREHIGVGAPWEHYANLGAIKSQIERGNVDQLIKMMQYLNKTANDNTNDNRYLAKQIRRMLHKAGVDTSAYSPTRKYAKGESYTTNEIQNYV